MSLPRLLIAAAIAAAAPTAARAGAEPFLGEIMFMSSTYCPLDFVEADGRLLPIDENRALFTLIGDRYGGDGRTTFAVPDLRKAIVDPGDDGEPRRRIKACIAVQGSYPIRD